MANPVRQQFPNKEAAARVILVDGNGNPYKASGGGGGSVEVQVNGVDTADQTVIDVINGNGIVVSNPTGGQIKIDAGNYITALTGDVAAAGPGSAAATLANTAVTPGSY